MNLHPLVKLFLYPLILTGLATFVANVPALVSMIPPMYQWLAVPIFGYLATLAAHWMKSPVLQPPPPPVTQAKEPANVS